MFNEEENVGHALALIVEALERHAGDYEIIVVDDASTDSSPAIVSRAAAANSRIRLLRHARNRTLGRTIRTGFASATMELVLYMDADLPVDPDELGRAIRVMYVTRADVVAGYRFDRVPEGYRRHIYSLVYNLLIRLLFHWPCRDINFAFKLLRREVLDNIALHSEGSLIDAELIVKARNAGFLVQQMGLDYFPRIYGQSNLASPMVVIKLLRELLSLYPEMRRRTRSRRPSTAPCSSSTNDAR